MSTADDVVLLKRRLRAIEKKNRKLAARLKEAQVALLREQCHQRFLRRNLHKYIRHGEFCSFLTLDWYQAETDFFELEG